MGEGEGEGKCGEGEGEGKCGEGEGEWGGRGQAEEGRNEKSSKLN